MGFFGGLYLILGIGFAVWALRRLRELEEKLGHLERRLGAVWERLFHTETALHEMRRAGAMAPPMGSEPVLAVAPPPLPPMPAPQFPRMPPPVPIPRPAYAAPTTPVEPVNVDLESNLATNWLSKLGVVILLIVL